MPQYVQSSTMVPRHIKAASQYPGSSSLGDRPSTEPTTALHQLMLGCTRVSHRWPPIHFPGQLKTFNPISPSPHCSSCQSYSWWHSSISHLEDFSTLCHKLRPTHVNPPTQLKLAAGRFGRPPPRGASVQIKGILCPGQTP